MTLTVSGADLMNGTPIYDIKPYLPYADCKPEATGGFTDTTEKRTVTVSFSITTGRSLPIRTAVRKARTTARILRSPN